MPVLAQAPAVLPLQGTLGDAAGVPIDGVVSVTFALYAAATDADAVWSETQAIEVNDGLFTALLGSASELDLGLFARGEAAWLGITIEGDSELPRIEVGSTPYAGFAQYASDAQTLAGFSVADLIADATAAAIPAAIDGAVAEAVPAATDAATAAAVIAAVAEAVPLSVEAALVAADARYAPIDHAHAWTELLNVPPGFADGSDADSFAALACADGQVPQWVGGAWSCTVVGDITAVSAGAGMTGGGSSGGVTLGVDYGQVQARLTSTCAAGFLTGINADGTPICSTRELTQDVYVDGVYNRSDVVSSRRLHLRTTGAASGGDTRPIPHDVFTELCGDVDGCEVRLGMTRWDAGNRTAAAARSTILYYDPANGHFRSTNDADGIDNNGSTTHAFQIYDTCYLTDANYVDYSSGIDNTVGFNLLTWNTYTGVNRTCELTIED